MLSPAAPDGKGPRTRASVRFPPVGSQTAQAVEGEAQRDVHD
jgi:hypothetical protein